MRNKADPADYVRPNDRVYVGRAYSVGPRAEIGTVISTRVMTDDDRDKASCDGGTAGDNCPNHQRAAVIKYESGRTAAVTYTKLFRAAEALRDVEQKTVIKQQKTVVKQEFAVFADVLMELGFAADQIVAKVGAGRDETIVSLSFEDCWTKLLPKLKK